MFKPKARRFGVGMTPWPVRFLGCLSFWGIEGSRVWRKFSTSVMMDGESALGVPVSFSGDIEVVRKVGVEVDAGRLFGGGSEGGIEGEWICANSVSRNLGWRPSDSRSS